MTIKKIFAIASAKGGVGKSSITAGMAIEAAKKHKVGLLDADIYGPNQHLLFDIDNTKPQIIKKNEKKLFKPVEASGVLINSMGLILDSEKAALWRGPMLSGAIKQLIHSTDWGDLDILFVDMPPGTGDAYLTIASEIKPDHSILVSTPNKLAQHDLIRSIELFNFLDIDILGYIENNISTYKQIVQIVEERDIDSAAYMYMDSVGSYDGEYYLTDSFKHSKRDDYGMTKAFFAGILSCFLILGFGWRFIMK